jgi:TraM recognition site of TraD and TraG
MTYAPGLAPDHIDLGQVEAPSTAQHELLRALVYAARERLEALIDSASYLSDASKWRLFYELAPLEYREYGKNVGRFDTLRKELRAAIDRAEEMDYEKRDFRPLQELGPEVMRFVEVFVREEHTPDAEGYRTYVGDVCPALLTQAARTEKQAKLLGHFPEATRAVHTHILGGRNAGKSELMKLLIHHYVKHPQLGAVVVIDPHGDLARDISKWREFEADPERLVYLDGGLSPDHYPALNPLAVSGLSPDERDRFAVLMGDAIGALSATRDLTDNMRNLARNSLRIVLEGDTPSLQDVVRLLGSEDNPAARPLLARARAHPDLGEWFSYKFTENSLSASKAGLADRLENVLLGPKLGRMLKSPTALPLDEFCAAGKVVLVSLAGADGGNELGRLMLARVAMIGWRRASNSTLARTPVHVFVDEAQRMIGPTILEIMNELRKFGMRLTLAHQSLSQVDSANLQETLWNGAGIKIIGATEETRVLARVFGSDPPKIPMHQFAIRWGSGGDQQAVVLRKPRNHLRDGRNDMSPAAWRRLIQQQLETYYTQREAPASAPSIPRPSEGLGELL